MRRGAVIAVAATVALAVAGGAVAWWLLSRPPSAEDGAMRYLQALAAGDAQAVTALQQSPLDGGAQTLLEAAFLGADEYPADPRVDDVSDDNTVRATVVLGGEARTIVFGMALDGTTWLVTPDHLASLTVTTTLGDSVLIGGALAPAVSPVALLPAVYTVSAAPAEAITGSTAVVVTNAEPVTAAVEASVSPDGIALAQQQLDAYQDACTITATAVPSRCGLRVPWAADLATLTSISWRIDQRPVLALAPDARSFAATGGVVVATAAGTTADGEQASFTYRADDWALRGSVEVTGDTMTLAVF